MRIIFLILLLSLSSCSSKSTHKTPRLALENDTIKIDTILYGNEYSRKITISNTGTAPLKISGIQSSCDCTIPMIKDSILQPSEKSFFMIRINPNKTGSFARSIVIESNAKEQYKVIELNGYVK